MQNIQYIFIVIFLHLVVLSVQSSLLPDHSINLISTEHHEDKLQTIVKDLELLRESLIPENIPIFSLNNDIDKVIEKCTQINEFSQIITLENLYYDYMGLLRDFYFKIFQNKINDTTEDINELQYEEIKKYYLNEFNVAINKSTPTSERCLAWHTEGYVEELIDDMNTYYKEYSWNKLQTRLLTSPTDKTEDVKNIKMRPIIQIWKKITKPLHKYPKVLKYSKWIAVQVLLFSINFAQNEVNRRNAKHAAYRRLAEVPEFPLL